MTPTPDPRTPTAGEHVGGPAAEQGPAGPPVPTAVPGPPDADHGEAVPAASPPGAATEVPAAARASRWRIGRRSSGPRPPWKGWGAGHERAGEPPWLGMVAGGVWLVYMAPAAHQVVDADWPLWQRIVGGALLVTFGGVYLSTLAIVVPARRSRSARQAGFEPIPGAAGDREMQLRVAVMVVIGLGTSIAFGDQWLTTMAFISAILGITLDRPWAPRAVIATAAVCEGLLLLRGTAGDDSSYFWLAFAVLIAGFVSYAARRRGELEGELERSRELNARFAVVDERNRIARDLHDLLGHSLSVIAVKSQLAERLLERDEPERAAAEIQDVRGVARDALREVRQVVDGYRRRPLAAELASSAAALRSGDLEVQTELPAAPIPQPVEDAVSFVIREGTTNVLRHSRASRCALAVRVQDGHVVATVEDDGPVSVAPRVVGVAEVTGAGTGNGLVGLAERLALVQGRLDVGPGADGGTRLRATVPVGPAPTAGTPTPGPVAGLGGAT